MRNLALALVTLVSFFTYFRDYSEPPYFYWDENYHIASAQKYINHVFFMEPHPPLGKLFIALGEYLIDPNPIDNQFLETDHAPTTPTDFSFRGYRFFPVLFAWLTAPLLFLIFFELTKLPWRAALFTAPYVFENAIIVHNRGAMLEGTQLFFMVLTLYFFIHIWNRRKCSRLQSVIIGLAFGAALAVKINALVLTPLIPLISIRCNKGLSNHILFMLRLTLATCFIFCFSWYIHINIATNINPKLSNGGYYRASEEYKEILKSGRTGSLSAFPVMLRDSFKFVPHYEKGVPRLNLCKSDENGSYPLFWPLGGGSINYRWERHGELVQYLYLQVNPWGWLIALVALVVAIVMVISQIFFVERDRFKNLDLIGIFLGLYIFYMFAVMRLDRVFYLYHYFIPLIFCYILFALVFPNITRIGNYFIADKNREIALGGNLLLTFVAFWYMSPLTYYGPLKNDQIQSRSLLSLWDLRCQGCIRTNPIALPLDQKITGKKVNPDWSLTLGPLKSVKIEQEWGDPKKDRTVDDLELVFNGKKYEHGFGVHAYSKVDFKLDGKFARFKAFAGLPDYLEKDQGSAIFEVHGDGKRIARSPTMHRGDSPYEFDVSVSGVKELSLITLDGGDSNDHDHTCWIEPKIE